MATFYSSSTDPSQVPYPNSSIKGSMLYVNSSSSDPYSDSLPVTQSQQHYVQLPTTSATNSQGSFAGGPDNAYNASRFGDNNYVTEDFVQSSHLDIFHGHKLSLEQPKGLSLSLGTEIPMPSFQYQSTLGDDSPGQNQMHVNYFSYGIQNFMTPIPNSKYLKAAKQLLDEVVNVQNALKKKLDKSQSFHTSGGTENSKDIDGGPKSDPVPSNPQDSTANSSNELSTSERQDLQNKVTKLSAMLDEVSRRYKQYYHQMQILVSSFDAVAGSGAAKPYTSLALQTISRHFRCLKDALTSQISTTRQSLGQKENSSGNGVGISRLRYIDQKIRQQRAMQQFGMMQPHAWRPQRGLPENSVSILRAWLFEHFLHPYPKDSEKLMLARQTGLTRGQVANWFINARVRLWKPMIEEMYKEEFDDPEIDFNSSSKNPSNVHEETKCSEDGEDPQQSAASEMCQKIQYNLDNAKSNPISYVDGEDALVNLKPREQSPNGENYGLLREVLSHPNGSERLISYQMTEMSRYENGGVSLTLGLQNHEGGLPISDVHQNFIAVRGENVYGSDATIGRDDFEYTNEENQQRQFVPSHLMHDFVA